MSIDKLSGILDRKVKKEPACWPFCICCHLAAPESKTLPMDLRNPSSGMAPDVSTWGTMQMPNKHGHKEQYHTCEECTTFVAVQLYRNHEALKRKFKKITAQRQAKDFCGLRLEGHLNPFKSAFCSKQKGHLDACA